MGALAFIAISFILSIGEPDGLWTEWDEDGQKQREETYKDGKLVVDDDEKMIIIPNKILESSKGDEFIVGSMYYYGEGREKNMSLAKSYLQSFLDESSPENYNNWQYLEAKEMLYTEPNNEQRNYPIQSSDGTIKIYIGPSNVQYVDEIYGVLFSLEIIEVNTPSSITVFNNLEPFDKRGYRYRHFTPSGWVDDDNFIIHAHTSKFINTFILNVRTMKFKLIANGIGIIVNYPQIGQVLRLNGQKRYLQSMHNPPRDKWGAFWIDTLYDFEGNLLKILSSEPQSSNDKCYFIKDLIDIRKHKFLIQDPDDCIFFDY